MKKLVVETDNRHLYVMEPSGKIDRISARKGVKVGDMVECSSTGFSSTLLRIAAVLILVAGIAVFPTMQAFAAPAYLTVDINPSIELTFKNSGTVSSAKALNEDGEKVLSELSLEKLSTEDAITAILAKAEEMGFIKDDSTETSPAVYITVSSKKDSLSEDLKAEAEKAATDYENQVSISSVVVEKIPIERHEEAESLGVSPGKLLLAQRLAELDPTITASDVVNDTVQSIMKRIITISKEEKAADKLADDTKEFLTGVANAQQRQEQNLLKQENKANKEDADSTASESTAEAKEKNENANKNTNKSSSSQISDNANNGNSSKKSSSSSSSSEAASEDVNGKSNGKSDLKGQNNAKKE